MGTIRLIDCWLDSRLRCHLSWHPPKWQDYLVHGNLSLCDIVHTILLWNVAGGRHEWNCILHYAQVAYVGRIQGKENPSIRKVFNFYFRSGSQLELNFSLRMELALAPTLPLAATTLTITIFTGKQKK